MCFFISKMKDPMYIFLVSLLLVVPSIIADKTDHPDDSKAKQVFDSLPNDIKYTICGLKEVPWFCKFRLPDDSEGAKKIIARCNENDPEMVTLIIENIKIAEQTLADDKASCSKATSYQVPRKVLNEWCKESQKALLKEFAENIEKLKITQQGDN